MEFYDIFTVTPAEHITESRFLIYIWLQKFKCKDTLDMILQLGASPTGEAPPTHYYCASRISEKFLEMQKEETKNRTAKIFDWCHPEITDDKNIALTNFALMLKTEQEGLDLLGLKKCK